MSQSSPRVSVLLPVRDGERSVGDAISSILQQSFDDLELIVLDDGSVDDSVSIASSFRDDRVRVASYPGRGLPATLNAGILLARGRFVARMDADDLSLPGRLEKQVRLLEGDPSITACGVWTETFGSVRQIWRYPADHEAAKATLLFRTPFVHPSAMVRRDVLIDGELRYDEELMSASEDWDLWLRVARRGKLANVPEVLFRYRIRAAGDPSRDREKWRDASVVARRALEAFGLTPNEEEVELHLNVAHADPAREPDFLERAEEWLLRVRRINKESGWCSAGAMDILTTDLWGALCVAAASRGVRTLPHFRKSPLFDGHVRRRRQLASITARSLRSGRG